MTGHRAGAAPPRDAAVRRVPARVVLALLLGALLAACAGPGPIAAPAGELDPPTAPVGTAPVGTAPVGTAPGADGRPVRVAYPHEPWTLQPWGTHDLAARDLAALWGLPLFRVDPDGQLEPALVASASTRDLDDALEVVLTLRPGSWSDGTPVEAGDVVATLELLRALPTTRASWEAVREVRVDDDAADGTAARVVVVLPPGHGRWPWLLAELATVVPAHMASVEGLAGYAAGVPVSGGPWQLAEREPGRSLAFTPHATSPLGPPRAAGLHVLVVPDYETALGLLDRGEVDVVVGHLALDPVARAERLDGVVAAAPLGGTLVELRWYATGRAADRATRDRLAAAADVDALVEGLLRAGGSPLASLDLAPARPVRPPTDLTGRTLTLAVPRGQEVLGFAARTLQRGVAAAGGTLALAFVDPDRAARGSAGPLDRPADPGALDGQLRVRRTGAWQDAVGLAAEAGVDAPGLDAARAHAVGARPDHGLVAPLLPGGLPTPLFLVGVAHAWTAEVTGVVPSSWPGLAFAGSGAWTGP